MNPTAELPIRLTQFSHGGGCGCKIAPGMLQQMLEGAGPGIVPADLLVGRETSDDAAVWRLSEKQAIVATTDFFMPIVDDPFDFGAIAATNAISDVYAMGGRPLFALALVGMPIARIPLEVVRSILAGGESACARAGVPVAGGHSIDSVEPIYGLVVIGLVDPRQLKRNAGALPGDALVLGKPLGVGIYSAALKRGRLDAEGYRTLVESATRLNTPGMALAGDPGVHALTDVTGFGLLGHLLEICRASNVGARIDAAHVPLHPGVAALATAGMVTGASARNWAGYGPSIDFAADADPAMRAILTDPQTSGGLLVACAPETAAAVVDRFRSEGFDHVAVIGGITAGTPRIAVA